MDPLDIFPKADELMAESLPEDKDHSPVRLVLTIDEAAEWLGIGRTLMSALVRSGEVESVRIDRLRRIPADALVKYVEALRGRTPHEQRDAP